VLPVAFPKDLLEASHFGGMSAGMVDHNHRAML